MMSLRTIIGDLKPTGAMTHVLLRYAMPILVGQHKQVLKCWLLCPSGRDDSRAISPCWQHCVPIQLYGMRDGCRPSTHLLILMMTCWTVPLLSCELGSIGTCRKTNGSSSNWWDGVKPFTKSSSNPHDLGVRSGAPRVPAVFHRHGDFKAIYPSVNQR